MKMAQGRSPINAFRPIIIIFIQMGCDKGSSIPNPSIPNLNLKSYNLANANRLRGDYSPNHELFSIWIIWMLFFYFSGSKEVN